MTASSPSPTLGHMIDEGLLRLMRLRDVIKSVAETINYEDQDVEKTPVSSSDKKRGRPRKQSYLGNVKGMDMSNIARNQSKTDTRTDE
ncbi:hypothetical protein Tco_1420067 [Tanacetum coccineum]